jgi:DNA-3-methyladenine glycosylase
MAMDVDRRMDGQSLHGDSLWITTRDVEVGEHDIAVSPRVGIDNSGEAAHWPLRFYLRGNAHVSRPRS